MSKMQIQSLQDLFINGLQYVYDAEQQLTKALPKLAEASSNQQLKQAFEQHLQETQQHVKRLEQIFQALGKQPETKPNNILQAMSQETEQMIENIQASALRDAALIVAGNQAEHYEMASYGSLRNFAQVLGNQQCVQLLEQTLDEEKKADAKLTQIAESQVNKQAADKAAQSASAAR